ncbi:hypothetical protein BDV97DRAFT_144451 [Delphinella strobiligena]|nr:hypothetical protein BDV97DRAFT_144451 [Delphinella strobiligena]
MLEFLTIMTGRAQKYYADSSSLGCPNTVVVGWAHSISLVSGVGRWSDGKERAMAALAQNGTYHRQGTGDRGYLVWPARSGLCCSLDRYVQQHYFSSSINCKLEIDGKSLRLAFIAAVGARYTRIAPCALIGRLIGRSGNYENGFRSATKTVSGVKVLIVRFHQTVAVYSYFTYY